MQVAVWWQRCTELHPSTSTTLHQATKHNATQRLQPGGGRANTGQARTPLFRDHTHARVMTFLATVGLCALCILLLLLQHAAAAEDAAALGELERGMTQSYYELLGIDHAAVGKDIKKASAEHHSNSAFTTASASRLSSVRILHTSAAHLPTSALSVVVVVAVGCSRYRAAALRFHPDKYAGDASYADAAREVFIRIARANEVLADAELRTALRRAAL